MLNLKCWAVMLGVVTGSSSMTFFSQIQVRSAHVLYRCYIELI